MATLKLNIPARWSTENEVNHIEQKSIWSNWMAFADSQKASRTLWFMVSLIVQGVLFLPLPAFLIYYYNAPVLILAITLILFFSNIIVGMGGSSIRVTLSFFAVSVLVHLLMLAIFTL